MLLHLVGNAPIYWTKWFSPDVRQAVLALCVLLFTLAMVGLLVRVYDLDLRQALLGRAKSPECGFVYDRRWLAVNMGSRRYELCPGCKNRHWTETVKEDAESRLRRIRSSPLGTMKQREGGAFRAEAAASPHQSVPLGVTSRYQRPRGSSAATSEGLLTSGR